MIKLIESEKVNLITFSLDRFSEISEFFHFQSTLSRYFFKLLPLKRFTIFKCFQTEEVCSHTKSFSEFLAMVNKPVVEKVSLRWYLATYSKLPVGELTNKPLYPNLKNNRPSDIWYKLD